MTAEQITEQIQTLLGVDADGRIGRKTRAAFDRLADADPTGDWPPSPALHSVKATSFADPADVLRFRECKVAGGSDEHCFSVGDNGVGFMGDDCTGPTPMCALPVEDWMERWGSKQAARLKPVIVMANGRMVQCLMGDTMPHRAHIHNGAGIDLNPAACAALGLNPPVKADAQWEWV